MAAAKFAVMLYLAVPVILSAPVTRKFAAVCKYVLLESKLTLIPPREADQLRCRD